MQNRDNTDYKVQSIANWLIEKKAKDIISIDISDFGSITDVIIVASSVNIRHNQALADFVLEKVSENRWEYLGMEGYKAGSWILIDLNEIIVHLFLEETREFYNIEGLWRGAKKTSYKVKEMAHEEF
ncbi:ribosome silencing factor [Desulfothermus okinawensis JCM 13304]